MVDVHVEKFGNRRIAIKGIGRLFFESGIPISITCINCEKEGIIPSYLHIADELFKNGWSDKAIINKLKEEMFDLGVECNLSQVEAFVKASYEDQREMIFQYLFGCNWNDVRTGKNTEPLKHFRNAFAV